MGFLGRMSLGRLAPCPKLRSNWAASSFCEGPAELWFEELEAGEGGIWPGTGSNPQTIVRTPHDSPIITVGVARGGV